VAEVVTGPSRYRNRRLTGVVLSVTIAVSAVVGSSPAAFATTSPYPNPPFPSCLPEQYPPAGSARNSTSTPYEIPFSATLAGGYLEINSPTSLVTVTLGGPINAATGDGTITASSCGVLALPSQKGGISGNPYGTSNNGNTDQYNNNFQFHNPIDISIGLKGVPGVPLLQGVGSAIGELAADIEPTPAANGGLNVDFYSSAKSTSVISACALAGLVGLLTSSLPLPTNCLPAGVSPPGVPGGTCTVPIGNLLDAGISATDFGTGPGQTGLSGAANTTPVHLSTNLTTSSGQAGQPVTGPITGATATLVANDFPVAAVLPSTPPSAFPNPPDLYDPTSTTLCSAANASLFNTLLGLPSPAGYNTFYAPGTFAIHTSA
jgi:hypothetical protein